MKKFFIILSGIIFFSLNSYCFNLGSWSMGIGVTRTFSGKHTSNRNCLTINGSVFNIYTDFTWSDVYGEVPESQYGSGGVSNNYELFQIYFGYVIKLFDFGRDMESYISNHDTNCSFYIIPMLGINSEQRLYNDKYYGNSIASSSRNFSGGIGIGIRYKLLLIMSKITNNSIGISCGIIL